MSWTIQPGERISRPELHRRYGGRLQGRISPSKESPNVFLFTTPGEAHSANDGWTGVHVHFTGEGVRGADQKTGQGNGTVLRHEAESRALRLFVREDPSGRVRYIGQFRLDPALPCVRVETAQDLRHPNEIHRALLFRLLPLNGTPQGLQSVSPLSEEITIRRTEPGTTSRNLRLARLPSPATGVAARLLFEYEAYARRAHFSDITGYGITLPDAVTELPVDLFDVTRNELIVVRPTAARPAIWTALGELLDLARYFDPRPQPVLLVPTEPSPDVTDLLLREEVAVIWASGPGSFERTNPAA